MQPTITEHVSLNSELYCKNMARALGDANNMCPLSWGGGGTQTEKIPFFSQTYFIIILGNKNEAR